MKPDPTVPIFLLMSMLVRTMRARSAGPKLFALGSAASTGMYSCGPISTAGVARSGAPLPLVMASSNVNLSEVSLKSRVADVPTFAPTCVVIVNC